MSCKILLQLTLPQGIYNMTALAYVELLLKHPQHVSKPSLYADQGGPGLNKAR